MFLFKMLGIGKLHLVLEIEPFEPAYIEARHAGDVEAGSGHTCPRHTYTRPFSSCQGRPAAE